jgi:nicotinamide-nucleotide amidase
MAVHLLTVAAAELGGPDEPGRRVAGSFLAAGIPVSSRQVLDEDEAQLDAALRAALAAAPLVVVLAGRGGSGGELVPRTLARIAGVRLVLNEAMLGALEDDHASRGRAMPRRLDRLALLPQGAALLPAPSGEPGWVLRVGESQAAVLPLASGHLEALAAALRPLATTGGGEVTLQRTLYTTGLGAAEAEERLGPWLGREGEVAVSSHLVDGDVWVRLRAREASRAQAEAALARVEPAVRRALGADCYGSDEDRLEAVVGRLLLERGFTLGLAESCTGGLLGHRLTAVPGSSRYLERGVVVYSNRAKEELLDVPAATLAAHGAVSAPVAEAMARGICHRSGAACGLAVTGIAGPDGGTPMKPVGTVFIGCATPAGVRTRGFRFPGDRAAVKWQSSQAALDMLRRALLAGPAGTP